MKQPLRLICCILSLILMIAAASCAGDPAGGILQTTEPPVITDPPTEPPDEIHSLSLIAAGDALIHGSVYQDAYNGADGTYDFRYQLELIKPIVASHDLAFYNQETIFGGAAFGYSNYPLFNTPIAFGDAMIDAGFNLVALSNNHSYDKGEQGVLNALDYWKAQPVLSNGINDSFEAQDDIQIRTKNNITYALLSYTTLNNGLNTPADKPYLVNYYGDERAARDVGSVRGKADVVIVSMHWGDEYSHEPNGEQIRIAEHLAALGVDIICGHHPHVLQPITLIGNTVVIYSMGNFISAQIGVERLTGALVSLEITKTNGVISVGKPSARLIYTYMDASFKNFKVVPFAVLDESALRNKQQVFEEHKSILTALDESIAVS